MGDTDLIAQQEARDGVEAAHRAYLELARFDQAKIDSICEATDGCIVEHDGTCQHGHPAWLLRLGLI